MQLRRLPLSPARLPLCRAGAVRWGCCGRDDRSGRRCYRWRSSGSSGWRSRRRYRGLADEQRPRFRQYVVQQRPRSHRYQEEVRVGAVLPSSGVTYYEVPAEYGVRDYRYTVVNDRTVLVDPRTHRVIQIIE